MTAIAAALLELIATLYAMLKLLVVIAAILGIFELLFDPKGSEKIGVLIGNIVRAVFKVASPILADVEGALEPVAKAFVDSVNSNASGIAALFRDPASTLAKTVWSDAEKTLTTAGLSEADNAVDTAANALGEAFAFGVASAGVTAAFEATFPEKLNTFNAAGPIFAKMSGFEEVAKAVREPLYANAFGKSLEYHYRSTFKPELPREFDAVLWHARGLLSEDQLKFIFDKSGLKTEYETPFLKSAYRAVSPFIVARATASGAITHDDLADVLQFGGYRPEDIARLLAAFEDVAIDPYRRQALAAFVAAAEQGLFTGPDIDTELNNLGVLPAAQPFIKKRIGYSRMTRLATLLERTVSDGYRYGQVADADYIPDLENAGIGSDFATARYGLDSTLKLGKKQAADALAAARLANRQQSAQVRALSTQYLTGVIDAAALTAGLTLAGVDPTISAYLIEYLAARKQAGQLYVYGKAVSPDEGKLLRQKVASVKFDYSKGAMPDTAARSTLASFGIGDDWIQALISTWSAEYRKTVLPP